MLGIRNQITIYLFIISAAIFLPGCTGTIYSDHFDCPYGEGAGCASLSKVNKMIDCRHINIDEEECTNNCSGMNGNSCASKTKQIYIYYGPEQMGKIIAIEGP